MASRTFSPPRIPLSQSWTTAVRIRRQTSGGRRQAAASAFTSPASCLLPPVSQGFGVNLQRPLGGPLPREIARATLAEIRKLVPVLGVRGEVPDPARDRVHVHRIDEVRVAAGDLLQSRRGRSQN